MRRFKFVDPLYLFCFHQIFQHKAGLAYNISIEMEKQNEQQEVKYLSNEQIQLRIKQALSQYDPTINYPNPVDAKVQESVIEKIKLLIQDFDKQTKKQGGLTQKHQPILVKSYKITLASLFGNLYYRIKQYQKADKFYQLLASIQGWKAPDEFYRQIGDCKRHLKEYQKAEIYYLKIKQPSPNKHKFSYSLGLLNLAKGDYKAARQNFNKAKKQTKDIPTSVLYGCAQIFAYFSDLDYILLDQEFDQFQQKCKKEQDFKITINQIKMNKSTLQKNISIQNLNFIKRILDGNLFKQAKKFANANVNANQGQKEKSRQILKEYYRNIFQCLQTIIQNPLVVEDLDVDTKLGAQRFRSHIERQDKQYINHAHIYNSMKNEFLRHIKRSEASTWNLFQKAKKNSLRGQIAASIVSYLPYVNNLQSIIRQYDEKSQEIKNNKIFHSINKLSQNGVKIEQIVKDAILVFMYKNKEQLFNQKNFENAIKERILPNWLNTFEPLANLVQVKISTIKQKLFGKQQESNPIRQYGIKLVNSFLTEKVVSQDYHNHKLYKNGLRRDYIQKSFTQIFKRDFGVV